MAREIIVPLDRSHIAECAIPYARALARRTGLPIALLSVIEPSGNLPEPPSDEELPPVEEPPEQGVRDRYSASLPMGVNPGATELSDSEFEAMTSALDEAEEYLDYIANSISEVHVEKRIVYGDPVQKILREAQAIGGFPGESPIVVMASHGRSGLGRVLLGSVAMQVAERVTCPMLLVRAMGSEVPSVDAIDLGKILIAVDGSSFAEEVIDPVRHVFGHDGTSFHFVRVVDVNRSWVTGEPVDTDPDGRTERDEAEVYLSTLAGRFSARGSSVTWDVVEGGPADRITQVAEDVGAGVIALATHGYSGLKRLRIGSVAEDVLHNATRPMFLVRPEETHGASE